MRLRSDIRVPTLVALVCLAAIGLAAIAGFSPFKGEADDAAEAASVRVAGSETMRPVVTACAEDFMVHHPSADIIVRGGGSGDGVAALLNGLIDVGMASRDLSPQERAYAESQKIDLTLTGLALDAVIVIVHRNTPISALDLEQLRDIFSGKVRNWREVGGGDVEIIGLARAMGSGTASVFGERVLDKETYGASVRRLPTNEAIVAEVAMRPGAIGYADLGSARAAGARVKMLALRTDPETPPVLPTPSEIRSGRYPLARTLYFATAGRPSRAAQAFLEFCSGPKGQALLQRAGYVGMTISAN